MAIAHEERHVADLDEAECLDLLGTAVIGRIAFTEGALPAVQPVPFAVRDRELFIPTLRGSKVAAASRGAVVAFEVDHFDPADRTGWNVTVVGPSRVVSDPREVLALDELGARPWPPVDSHCYVAVRISLVRGRRICGHESEVATAQARAGRGVVAGP